MIITNDCKTYIYISYPITNKEYNLCWKSVNCAGNNIFLFGLNTNSYGSTTVPTLMFSSFRLLRSFLHCKETANIGATSG